MGGNNRNVKELIRTAVIEAELQARVEAAGTSVDPEKSKFPPVSVPRIEPPRTMSVPEFEMVVLATVVSDANVTVVDACIILNVVEEKLVAGKYTLPDEAVIERVQPEGTVRVEVHAPDAIALVID